MLLHYGTAISGCIFKMWCGNGYGTVKVGLVLYIASKTVSSFDESDFIAGWVRRPDQKCINVINGTRTGTAFNADREQVFFLDAYMGYAHTRVGALQTTEYKSRTKMPDGYINSDTVITEKEKSDYDKAVNELNALRTEMLELNKKNFKGKIDGKDYHDKTLELMNKIDILIG